jgi:nicotinamidase-related amidase
MYSAFADPFENPCVIQSGLADTLRSKGITDVYVVGLAADYCVKCTALDAQKQGFTTWVIGEATKAVDPSSLSKVHAEYERAAVTVIEQDEAVQRVSQYAGQ